MILIFLTEQHLSFLFKCSWAIGRKLRNNEKFQGTSISLFKMKFCDLEDRRDAGPSNCPVDFNRASQEVSQSLQRKQLRILQLATCPLFGMLAGLLIQLPLISHSSTITKEYRHNCNRPCWAACYSSSFPWIQERQNREVTVKSVSIHFSLASPDPLTLTEL